MTPYITERRKNPAASCEAHATRLQHSPSCAWSVIRQQKGIITELYEENQRLRQELVESTYCGLCAPEEPGECQGCQSARATKAEEVRVVSRSGFNNGASAGKALADAHSKTLLRGSTGLR